MAKKDGMKFDIKISQDLYEWADPDKLREAREAAVTAAGMVWADETKELTRRENHIDTSLYVNSIFPRQIRVAQEAAKQLKRM